jgi:hypothetical protein
MRKLLFTGFMLVAISMGTTAQGLLHRMAGEPTKVHEVSMPEGAWYFELISEHEDAMLNVDEVRDGDRYASSLSAAKEGDARLFFIQTNNEYPTEADQPTQRIFGIGFTKGEGNYASRLYDSKGKAVLASELNEEQSAEAGPWWYIVPVEGNSPYVTIQNRQTKKMLTLGPLTDGKYELILSNPKSANNADQHWKLRLRPRVIF